VNYMLNTKVYIRQIRVFIVFLLTAVIISACGFQLRGNIVLPPLYERVYIIDNGYSDVAKRLTNALTNVGSEMLSSSEDATAVLTLLSHNTQRRALNVGGKQIREYELKLTIVFSVQDHQGVQLSQPQTVTVLRNFQNDPDNVLGKDNEELIIRKEMMQPAIIQVLQRMKALAH